jgi:serine/threonine-protein kinase
VTSSNTVLRCKECQREYPASAQVCPQHGKTLEEVDPMLGRIVARKYRLVRRVGKGGMGSVYEARHVHTDQRVAVKVLAKHLSKDLKLVARFRREAMATSRLRHPNCVQVHDFGEDDDGTFFIAMEFVDGTGIGDELRRSGPMPPERVARIGMQLLGALEAAHEAGILHRDLKPQNIMLTQKVGRPDFVKVVDFGIAKFIENSPEDQAALTLPGTIFGTPEYMSPEQARGETLDARSDLYSAAVVLWHMLLGRSPFRGNTVRETLMKVFRETPPSPSSERPRAGIPPGMEQALRRSLEKEPDGRYADATGFRKELSPFAPHTSAFEGRGSSFADQTASSVMPGRAAHTQAPPSTLDMDDKVGAASAAATEPPDGAGRAETRTGAAVIPTPHRAPADAATLEAEAARSSSGPDLEYEPATEAMDEMDQELLRTTAEAGPPASLRAEMDAEAAAADTEPRPAPTDAQTEAQTEARTEAAAPVADVPAPQQEPVSAPQPPAPRPSGIAPLVWVFVAAVAGASVTAAAGYAIWRAIDSGGKKPPPVVVEPPPPEVPAAERHDEAIARAKAAHTAGDADAARLAFKEALLIDERSPRARQGLAVLAMERKDYASAREHLEVLTGLGGEYEKQFAPMLKLATALAGKKKSGE